VKGTDRGNGALARDQSRVSALGLVPWDPDRRAEPRLLGAQVCICVATCTAVTLLVAGAISGDGFIAAVVTGVVLVGLSWMLVKPGCDHGLSRPSDVRRSDPPDGVPLTDRPD